MRNKRLPAKFIPKYMAALEIERANDKAYQEMKAKALEDARNVPDDPSQPNIPKDVFLQRYEDIMDSNWMLMALDKRFFSYAEKEIN
jgi:hypothetical protein